MILIPPWSGDKPDPRPRAGAARSAGRRQADHQGPLSPTTVYRCAMPGMPKRKALSTSPATVIAGSNEVQANRDGHDGHRCAEGLGRRTPVHVARRSQRLSMGQPPPQPAAARPEFLGEPAPMPGQPTVSTTLGGVTVVIRMQAQGLQVTHHGLRQVLGALIHVAADQVPDAMLQVLGRDRAQNRDSERIEIVSHASSLLKE